MPTGPGKVVVTTNMSRNVTFGPKVIVVQDIKISPGDVNPYVLEQRADKVAAMLVTVWDQTHVAVTGVIEDPSVTTR